MPENLPVQAIVIFLAFVGFTLGLSFYATDWAVTASSMAALVLLTVLLDAAVQTNQITGQRIIYAVPVETRGRMNAMYMTLLFAGGAIGSVLGTITYHWGDWNATASAGGVMGLLMLLLFAAELRGQVDQPAARDRLVGGERGHGEPRCGGPRVVARALA